MANARRKAEQHGAAKREETLRGWDDRAVEVFENGKMPGGPCIEVVESGLAEVDGDSFQLGWLLKQTCVIYDGIGGAPLEGAPHPCAEGAVAFAEEGRSRRSRRAPAWPTRRRTRLAMAESSDGRGVATVDERSPSSELRNAISASVQDMSMSCVTERA